MVRLIDSYHYAAIVATAILGLTAAVIAVPACFALGRLWILSDADIGEPALLLQAILKTLAFALPSAAIQTLVGFMAALFVSSFRRNLPRTTQALTVVVDLSILLPYLLPSIAWFWFTLDRRMTIGNWLIPLGPPGMRHLEDVASFLDLQFIALAHLAPFTYLLARLFFDHQPDHHVEVLGRHLGSSTKALLILGGRPMMRLLGGVFLLRVVITANKYDLPYFASKGYEGIRPNSWLFTLPLWLDWVRWKDAGLAIPSLFALTAVAFVGLIAVVVRTSRLLQGKKNAAPRSGGASAALLYALKASRSGVLVVVSVSCFAWMAGVSLFTLCRLADATPTALLQLLRVPTFTHGLVLTFALVFVLASAGALLAPICRVAHLLSDGWGVETHQYFIGLFIFVPPLLLAIAWHFAAASYGLLIYSVLLFIIAFPFLYLQSAAVWNEGSTSALIASLQNASPARLVWRHLGGGSLRDYAVTTFMIAYVVAINEVACADLLLPPGWRPINHAFVRLKPMFDANDDVLATAPLVVVFIGLALLAPLYAWTRAGVSDKSRS